MHSVELVSNLQRYTQEGVARQRTSRGDTCTILDVGHHEPLPNLLLCTVGIGLSPDLLCGPAGSHGTTDLNLAAQSIGHDFVHLRRIVHTLTASLADVHSLLTVLYSVVPACLLLLVGLGGEQLCAPIVYQILEFGIAVEERTGGIDSHTCPQRRSDGLGDTAILVDVYLERQVGDGFGQLMEHEVEARVDIITIHTHLLYTRVHRLALHDNRDRAILADQVEVIVSLEETCLCYPALALKLAQVGHQVHVFHEDVAAADTTVHPVPVVTIGRTCLLSVTQHVGEGQRHTCRRIGNGTGVGVAKLVATQHGGVFTRSTLTGHVTIAGAQIPDSCRTEMESRLEVGIAIIRNYIQIVTAGCEAEYGQHTTHDYMLDIIYFL